MKRWECVDSDGYVVGVITALDEVDAVRIAIQLLGVEELSVVQEVEKNEWRKLR